MRRWRPNSPELQDPQRQSAEPLEPSCRCPRCSEVRRLRQQAHALAGRERRLDGLERALEQRERAVHLAIQRMGTGSLLTHGEAMLAALEGLERAAAEHGWPAALSIVRAELEEARRCTS